MYQQQSAQISQNLGSAGGSAMKRRMESFMSDDDAAEAVEQEVAETGLSKDDLLRMQKEKKKVAKNNFGFHKK